VTDIDDAIDALVNHDKGNSELYLDEYEQWRTYEPKWTKEQHNSGNVIRYWTDLAPKYPHLSPQSILNQSALNPPPKQANQSEASRPPSQAKPSQRLRIGTN
jgi:hypothetical protein